MADKDTPCSYLPQLCGITHRQKCLHGSFGIQHHISMHPGGVSSISALGNRHRDSVLAVDPAMAYEPARALLSCGPEGLDNTVLDKRTSVEVPISSREVPAHQ